MNIACLAFAGSETTMGLSIVCDTIMDKWPDAKIVRANENTAKSADYLLVSLYWWRDVYEFVGTLHRWGINPKNKTPRIIVGGMAAMNPRVIDGFYHACVIGDGEACIVELIEDMEKGGDGKGIPGIWSSDSGCEMAISKGVQTKQYVDLRTNKTTRIEIARGCRGKCAFCQLAFCKPYREIPYDVARHLILTAPTKTIALFAPDRSSYSRIDDLDDCMKKSGKRNTGSDTRLDTMRKRKHLDSVRFGVEAFSAATRKKLHKVPTNQMLIDDLLYISDEATTSKGKRITTMTMYLIGDLPGEDESSVDEFWETMNEVDRLMKNKVTLFFSVASFAPYPFTPMENCAISPWTTIGKYIHSSRPRLKNITIASRGGIISPNQRLAQMLTIRGDESARLAVNWMATKGRKLFLQKTPGGDKAIISALKKSGFADTEKLYRNTSGEALPCDNIARPIGYKREWE